MDTLLKSIGIDDVSYEIIPLNGKDSLHLAKNQFQQNTAEGGKNLIVFDADSDENHGGYKRRKEELESKLQELKITAQLFLWPNDKEDGDFETMLENIAQKDLHQRFFDCFNDYEACLGSEYIRPNRKGKLHTYISSMRLSNRQRRVLGSGEWLFEEESLWNLKSSYLSPIKDFFKFNFIDNPLSAD